MCCDWLLLSTFTPDKWIQCACSQGQPDIWEILPQPWLVPFEASLVFWIEIELHHHTSSFALFCSAPVYSCFYKFQFKFCSWAVSGVLQLSVSCLAFCCGAGKLKNICRQGQSSLLFFREYLQSFIRLGPIPTPILDAVSTDFIPRASYKHCLYYYLELSHCRNPQEREMDKSS